MRGLQTRLARAVLTLVLVLLAAVASAQQRDADARAAFTAGRAAYEAKRYEEALEQFRRSYTLSGEPALLYNIASALQSLNRPGEAAVALRDFVKTRPNDPERDELESRIASLTEAQALADRESARKERLSAEEEAARHAASGWISESEVGRRMELELARERRNRKRTLALAVGLTVGPIVLGGIIAAIVCGTGKCSSSRPKNYDYGPTPVTP